MASPKGGLGKGLEALFKENTADEGQIITVRLSEIEPNRDQPRKQFDEQALAELTDSIAQHGVLQPLLVRPMAIGGYQLVAGERRWRAARAAGLTEVPVVIREMGDREAAELAMIENLQREDLNPMEEARGYQALMENYGMTQEETARVVNKSRPAVANALRLLHLPEKVADMVLSGQLSAGHARALLAFPTPELQETMAIKAVEENLSVRELEKRAKETGRRGVSRETSQRRLAGESFYSEVELALTEYLGRKVKVQRGAKGAGTLQLEFYSQDDLKELANRLYIPRES